MLAAGTRLGPYEIGPPLGQGGMGEVYRARDTRLERTVAIKVLPSARADDPQFRERFEREARAVSSLNHPNICVLHDIGNEGGVAYLVMECLEGETLAARLERGALPVAEALRYAIEIANALDAAHRRGVVHRDLKPGNIMLTKSGAKLVDFGLAKVRAMGAGASEQTATVTVTTEGSLVGTFQYMSPEQLEGHEADARSDIFAFGATLYEMLAGRKAFTGQGQASLITAIMSAQPAPVSSVREGVAAPLDRVVRRCLEKSAEDRWQSARDLAEELRWIAEGGGAGVAAPAAAAAKSRAVVPWIAAALCGVAAMAMGVAILRQEKPAPPRPMRFSVNMPEGTTFLDGSRVAISPDGEWVFFHAAKAGEEQAYLHSLANGNARVTPGVEHGGFRGWSPDSRSFLAGNPTTAPTRFEVNGNPPQTLQLPFGATYCSWGTTGIVTATGGEVRWFTPDGAVSRVLKSEPKATLGYASWLPGEQWLIYNKAGSSGGASQVHALSADGKTDRLIGETPGPAVYAAPGYLLISRGDVLLAQAFDAKKMELRGGPVVLADHVGMVNGGSLGNFWASAKGVLMFAPGARQTENQLTWLDRAGKRIGTVGDLADYTNPALSPDGTRLAVGVRDPGAENRDLVIFDLARNSSSRFTFDPGDDLNPVWSPDGSRLAFTSNRSGQRSIYVKQASGSGAEELLTSASTPSNAEDWSKDDRWIVFNRGTPARSLWAVSPKTRKEELLLESKSQLDEGRISPNGHWLAYRSFETGHKEVYIRTFAPGVAAANAAAGKWQISQRGGEEPQWRADGKELFFLSPDRQLMAVDIAEKDGAVVNGKPQALFSAPLLPSSGRNRWLPSADGKKFLLEAMPDARPVTSLQVILNWPSLVQK